MTWWLLPRDRRHQRPELRADERQSRLVSHGVLGECRLLELPVDGVALARGGARHAVLKSSSGRAVGSRVADVAGAGRREMHATGHVALSACSGQCVLE